MTYKLQDYYPGFRNRRKVYIRKEEMTQKDVDRAAKRMRSAGNKFGNNELIKHSDALRAFYKEIAA